jgi:small subunit ribosomal protein S8
MTSDPIADMLTRIRNGLMAERQEVEVPQSKIKLEIARILKEEGYIEDYVLDETFPPKMTITLKYYGPRRTRRPVITNIDRVSKPGRRIYVGKTEIPWVLSGMGIAIVSTSQGLMTDQQARRKGLGGEVLCTVK